MPGKDKKKVKPQALRSARGAAAAPVAAPVVLIPGWAPFAILAFTALLYFKALFNGLTGLDDDFYIYNNAALRNFSPDGLKTIVTSFFCGNYHPLTMVVYFVIYRLFGVSALPYHLLNVLLHLVNTFLVYRLTEKLSGKRITAVVVSLLFAVHPMHVESVAWASELKDVLYACWYLLALLAYLDYISTGYRPRNYAGVLLLFIASLLSKSAAVTLPVLLFVVDVYKGRGISMKSVLEKVPMLALSVVFGILAIKSQREGGAYNALMVSYGAVNSFFLFTSGIAFYLIWLVAPISLSIFHYFPDISAAGLLPWTYYASLPVVMLAVWLVFRKNQFRKEALFGSAFFLVAISVMLQVVSVGSALTAERYTYISYIGLFYIFGQLINSAIEKQKNKVVIAWVFACFVSAFSFISWNRFDVWKDDHSLFDDLVEKNPDFYYGYWLKGNTDKREGNLEAALADYSASIRLNPKFEDAYYNRGIINNAMGQLKAALADYNKSIELNPKTPDSYNNRGWVYFQMGDTASAIRDYDKAIALKPAYAEAWNNKAWADQLSGNLAGALQEYTKAIEVAPDYTRALFNRANLKAATKDYKGAVDDYTILVTRNPGESIFHLRRGSAYQALQMNNYACSDWEKARELGNKDALALLEQYCK